MPTLDVPDTTIAYRGAALTPPIPGEPPLTYGYNAGLPAEGFGAAWGARATIMFTHAAGTRTVALDQYFQSSAGPRGIVTRLLAALNGGINQVWMAEANQAIADGRLRRGDRTEVVLFKEDGITVKASHETWDGWLFVCAYTNPITVRITAPCPTSTPTPTSPPTGTPSPSSRRPH